MSDAVTVALISSGPGYIAGLFALLAWLKGRKNEKLIVDNTKVTEQTRELVNGHSELLIDAVKTIAKAEGIAEERERQK